MAMTRSNQGKRNDNDGGRKPAGDLYAILPPREDRAKDRWVKIGVLWETEGGDFTGEIETEPFEWRRPDTVHRVAFLLRKADR